jgi:hypothetical protein
MRTAVGVLLAALGSLAVVACRAPAPDAASVLSAWIHAANNRSLADAEYLFAEDAIIDDGSAAGGADRVHNWNAMVLDRYRLQVLRITPLGPEHATALLSVLTIETPRVTPIRSYRLDIATRDGKIRSLAWRQPQLSDWAAEPAPPAPAPSRPTTDWPWALAAVGALMGLGGAVWVLRPRRPRPPVADVPGPLVSALADYVAARRAPTLS